MSRLPRHDGAVARDADREAAIEDAFRSAVKARLQRGGAAENLRTETVTEYPGNAQVVDKRRRACAPGTRSSVLVRYGHTARQDQRLPAVSAAARRGWI